MNTKTQFEEHWVNIPQERLDRYEQMFAWNPATAPFYAAADVREGHSIVDFGCGPGHAAIEFTKWVGPLGHVHAMDINAEFIAKARTRALEHGVADHITHHLLEDQTLPLPDASVDRIIVRNTLIYVPDLIHTFREFHRCLKPGGLVHAIEGDWRLTAVEPVPTPEWRALIEAASGAWPRPEIGRSLYGIAKQARFPDASVQVLTSPDTTGRLKGMIDTVAGYARESGKMDLKRIERILTQVEEAIANGTYLAISPQFVVTASV